MRWNRVATIAAIGLLSLLVVACAAQTPAPTATAGFVDITPAEAKALIDENPDLIVMDVSPVYAQGHLPGAVNYPIGDGSLDEAIPSLDRSAEYLVYCHSDSASINGAQKLIDAGFETVYRLEGNYAAWVDAGYPVES
jgi:rhodanese-related sulfurtransferase